MLIGILTMNSPMDNVQVQGQVGNIGLLFEMEVKTMWVSAEDTIESVHVHEGGHNMDDQRPKTKFSEHIE